MYTSSHGFLFIVLSFEGVLHISVATLCRKIRDWEARWDDDWFEKCIILLVNGYFWLTALSKFILLYKQLFDFICRWVVCNALKEVGYILGVLWNGDKVNILCCGCEKCIVGTCISCYGIVWHWCAGVQKFVSEHSEKEEENLERRKENLKKGFMLWSSSRIAYSLTFYIFSQIGLYRTYDMIIST